MDGVNDKLAEYRALAARALADTSPTPHRFTLGFAIRDLCDRLEGGGVQEGVIRLTLPEPPSANRYWRTFRGRAVKSAEARAFVTTVHGLARAAKVKPITSGPVAVDITWVRGRKAGDLDNRLKIVLDALGRGLCYKDDRQITEITMHRRDGTAPGKLEVSVWALE